MNLKFWKSNPDVDVAEALQNKRGDADALALMPYDDGTFYLKPCNFDKELIGGQGGYETEDGDKIVLDGDGEPVKQLLGVDVILSIDPTEHAAAVEPVKAFMAQKNNIGEWLKVDRQGNIIEVGEALMPAPESDVSLDDVGPEGTAVEERADEIVEEQRIRKRQAMELALEELEKEHEVTKVMDLAPPAAPKLKPDVKDVDADIEPLPPEDSNGSRFSNLFGNGETAADGGMAIPEIGTDNIDVDWTVDLEEATHIAVDQSKATDLMPTTTSTVELNTALDKARMEEYEEGKLMKYFVYGLVSGALVAVVFGGIMVGINALF